MAVAGLPRLWGAAKLETSDVRLGPELDDIVVVPPLNFANTSVVLRTIDALLTTNPPQTAKALLAIRNTARVLPKLVISATPHLMRVIMDALFSSDQLSRGCAAAALCALAATQQGRDFMGIHGPMYGVAVIVKFLQVFLPRGADGHDLQHACLALANLATEAKCLDQLVRSDVVALMMRVLRGGLAPQLVHVQLQQVVQSVSEMPFAHMPRAVHAAVTLLLNMSCHQSARMQMIQAGLPRLLESVLTLADKRQQAERARVLARFQQHRSMGLTGRRSIAATGAAADAAHEAEHDQGHESEHDSQEQQPHKEGEGEGGEGPVYPPEDVFFTRCKLLAGAMGAHHVMANIATMERLAEEAASVFDPYKSTRRLSALSSTRTKDFLPPGYLAAPMLLKDLERHNISISRPDSPVSSATTSPSAAAADQETPLRRYLSSKSSRSRSPGRQTTFGRPQTTPEPMLSQLSQQQQPLQQRPQHQAGKQMQHHGSKPASPSGSQPLSGNGSKPLSAHGSKQVQPHGSKQLQQHGSKQIQAHGSGGGQSHKQHATPALSAAQSMRRNQDRPDSAGGRSAVSGKSLKSHKSFRSIKSFRSTKSLRLRSSSPPGGLLEPRLSDIPTRLSASEAAEAIAALSVSHPDLPRAMIATAVNSPPPKLEKWTSMQWTAAATVAGQQISPPQRGRRGNALLQVVDDAMVVSGFVKVAGEGSPGGLGSEGAHHHHHRRHHRRKHHKHRKKHRDHPEDGTHASDSEPESLQEGVSQDPTTAASPADKQRQEMRSRRRQPASGVEASPRGGDREEEEEEEEVALPVVLKGSLLGTRPPPLFLPSQALPRVKVASGVTAGVFRV